MENKIKFSKDDLYNYYLTMLLINNSSKNQALGKSYEQFLERFKNYFKLDKSDKFYIYMLEYAEISVEYYQKQSAITIMFHFFEQFIKIFFGITTDKDYFIEAKKIIEKYDYKFEENNYYEIVDKYRLLNNSIKHGGVKELERKYPELINTNCDIDKYGTIFDSSLNIDDSNIDECCTGLMKFITEMYEYFENNGYIDE